jgi:hypothetical protein
MEAVDMLLDTDVAWAAGFIDGEGNAGIPREILDYRRQISEQMHLLNRGKPVEESEPTLKSRQIRLIG